MHHPTDRIAHTTVCYTSRGALAGTRNSSMGPPREGSIRRPIAPRANALPLRYVPLRKEERRIAIRCRDILLFTGCEYGDKSTWCQTDLQPPYNCYKNGDLCCETCAKFYNPSFPGFFCLLL